MLPLILHWKLLLNAGNCKRGIRLDPARCEETYPSNSAVRTRESILNISLDAYWSWQSCVFNLRLRMKFKRCRDAGWRQKIDPVLAAKSEESRSTDGSDILVPFKIRKNSEWEIKGQTIIWKYFLLFVIIYMTNQNAYYAQAFARRKR